MKILNQKHSEYLIAISLLLIFVILAITSSLKKAPTFDEPVHLTSGYNAIINRDFRVDPENGIIPNIWAAIPLLFYDNIQFPDIQTKRWHQWIITRNFLISNRGKIDKLFLYSRIMMIAFGLFGGIIVFNISKKIWGHKGGLISLTLYSLSPTIIAHSRLITSDILSSIFFLSSTWAFWKLLNCFTLKRWIFFTVCITILALSKMSGIIIIPVLIIIAVIRIMVKKKWKVKIFKFNTIIIKPVSQIIIIITLMLITSVFLVISIWGAYGFRYSLLKDKDIGRETLNDSWDYVLKDNYLPQKTIKILRNYELLPEAFLFGTAHTIKNSTNRGGFLNGTYSKKGWPYFFPLCFLYKTHLTVIVLFSISIYLMIIMHLRSYPRKKIFLKWLWIPMGSLILTYGSISLISQLNIGQRHLIPIYLPIFVIAGGSSFLLNKKFGKIFIFSTLLLLFIESIIIFPNYLSYFNPIAGGPKNGYKHLVDSSLDWGQDLKGLREWLSEEHPDFKNVYIAYFGTIPLEIYDMPQKKLLCFFEQTNKNPFILKEGIYCISATMLQMVQFSEYAIWDEKKEEDLKKYKNLYVKLTNEDYKRQKQLIKEKGVRYWFDICRKYEKLRFAKLASELRKRAPDKMIGSTYLIYYLKQDDINNIIEE